MYVNKKSFRLAHTGNDLVLLNLGQNKFHIIPNLPLFLINETLAGEIRAVHQDILNALNQLGVIEPASHPLVIEEFVCSGEFFEERWMLPDTQNSISAAKQRIAATVSMLSWNIFHRQATFPLISKKLENLRSRFEPHKVCFDNQILDVFKALNDVFTLDLTGNKCLSYAYCACELLIKNGFDAKLVVGVKTRPFFSHAWVELDGRCLTDERNLSRILSIIFRS